jgi:hypothetical protein
MQRVPAVMDLYILVDMGRMASQSRWEDAIIYLPVRIAAVTGLHPSIRLLAQRGSMA